MASGERAATTQATMPAEVVAHEVDPSPDFQGVQELEYVLGDG